MNPQSTATRLGALAILLISALPAGTANAQITLTRANFPFPLGTYEYTAHIADNMTGASTEAINAIIAASGPGQTYDFTTIAYDDVLTGTHTVLSGAVGPGSEEALLGTATHTLIFPLRMLEDSVVVEGTIYLYMRLTDALQLDLGAHMAGEVEGEQQEFTLVRRPGGDTTAVFPYSYGDAWSSTYSESIFGFSSEYESAYSVDGWGTLVGPGAESGVPVLRVRVATSSTFFGFTSTTVCYEFRSAEAVLGDVCEGGFMTPPTAQLMHLGAATTSAEAEQPVAGAALDAIYPNPASHAAQLEFQLDRPGQARLALYDLLGREVRHVAEGWRGAGSHAATADVSGLVPGLYFARLTVDGRSWTRPLSVVR